MASWSLVNGVAIGLNLVALVALFDLQVRKQRDSVEETSFPPTLQSRTPYYFQQDEEFMPATPYAAEAWYEVENNLITGAVHVKDPALFGLRPSTVPSDEPGISIYAVSMFHQLHCLVNAVRLILIDRKANKQQATIRATLYSGNATSADLSGIHIGHCFEYIRQSIMCAADLTLERAEGWDEVHMCKDQGEVMSFMAANNPSIDL